MDLIAIAKCNPNLEASFNLEYCIQNINKADASG
jgi:hypothetical protein